MLGNSGHDILVLQGRHTGFPTHADRPSQVLVTFCFGESPPPHSLGSPSSQGCSDIQSVTAPSSACSWPWDLVTDPLWEEHRCQGIWRQCLQASLYPSPLRASPLLCSSCGESSFRKVACVLPYDHGGLWEGGRKGGAHSGPPALKCPLPHRVRGGGHKFCVLPSESLKKDGGFGEWCSCVVSAILPG